MIFTRTQSGISNYPAFLNVDIVAFCEGGGKSIDPDIDDANSTPRCCDTLYWEGRLAKELPGTQLAVRAIGGKPAVLNSFEKVRDIPTEGLLFCLDSDYDKLLGVHETDSRIRYTDGYSIENDILDNSCLKTFVSRIEPTLADNETQEFANEVTDLIDDNLVLIRRFIIADMTLVTLRRTRLFDGSLDRYIYSSSCAPKIDYPTLRRRTLDLLKNRPKMSTPQAITLDARRDLKGHYLFDLAFQVIKHVFRQKTASAFPGSKSNAKKWLCASA